MTVSEALAPLCLLEDLRARGLAVTTDGKDVFIRPSARIPAEWFDTIRKHKPALMAILDADPIPNPFMEKPWQPRPSERKQSLVPHPTVPSTSSGGQRRREGAVPAGLKTAT